MSAPILEIDVGGQERMFRRLAGIVGKLDNFEPLGEALEPVVYGGMRAHFEGEGGGQWSALSPRYAAWKQRRYPGRRIMVRTGELEASLTGRDARFSVRRVNRHGGEWGTKAPGAKAHDRGAPSRGLPKRRLILIDNTFRRDLLATMREYVHGVVGADS